MDHFPNAKQCGFQSPVSPLGSAKVAGHDGDGLTGFWTSRSTDEIDPPRAQVGCANGPHERGDYGIKVMLLLGQN